MLFFLLKTSGYSGIGLIVSRSLYLPHGRIDYVDYVAGPATHLKCIIIALYYERIFSPEGDPHFTVPLLSKEILCYSIQGYPGLAFNLIYNKDFIINVLLVDTEGDTSEATWIGKLAVIP